MRIFFRFVSILFNVIFNLIIFSVDGGISKRFQCLQVSFFINLKVSSSECPRCVYYTLLTGHLCQIHLNILLFCTAILIFSVLAIYCVGHNTNLASNSNILQTVRVNIAFKTFKKELFSRVFDRLSNDIQVDKLCTCGSVLIDV